MSCAGSCAAPCGTRICWGRRTRSCTGWFPTLIRQMGDHYPELARGKSLIEETLRPRNRVSSQTLERGSAPSGRSVGSCPKVPTCRVTQAFKLYDTFGFPLDLTQDALREQGRAVDIDGFDSAMAEQKTKARAAWVGSGEADDASQLVRNRRNLGCNRISGLRNRNRRRPGHGDRRWRSAGSASGPRTAWIVVNQTPFYGEAGGQVGDKGFMVRSTTDTCGTISDTQRFAGGAVFAHETRLEEGTHFGRRFRAPEVDHARRAEHPGQPFRDAPAARGAAPGPW